MSGKTAFRSLWGMRLFVMVAVSVVVIGWFFATDPFGGADTRVRLQFLAFSVLAALPAYLVLRALSGTARGHDAWAAALRPRDIEEPLVPWDGDIHHDLEHEPSPDPIAAAILWAARMLSAALIYAAILFTCANIGGARAADSSTPPPGALAYSPALRAELAHLWPDAPDLAAIAAQVEQETCVSLRSSRCWSPRAELKMPREYGFGLGQITVTARFNNFEAARHLHASLVDWAWPDRFDAARQLRVLVLMDRNLYRSVQRAADGHERLAMAMSAYNGGAGGLAADRRLCGQVAGCDASRWFGHVEVRSLKARAAAAGYGQSFFSINRGYVRAVLLERRPRYVRLMEA